MSGSDQRSDMGSLWVQAIANYEKTVKNCHKKDSGFRLADLKINNLQDVIQVNEDVSGKFAGKRDDGTKSTAVRSAFSRHLDGIQKSLTVVQVAGTAAAAFPPAMPASFIFAACGHVLKAFAAVKADYDKVQEFFVTTSRFFDRLSLIENVNDKPEPLVRCIERVFSCMLTIYAKAYSMIQKASHLFMFMKALWNLEDPDLAGAFAAMKIAIDELASAVGLSTLKTAATTQEDVGTANEKLDLLDSRIDTVAAQFQEMHLDIHDIMDNVLGLRKDILEGFQGMGERFDVVDIRLTQMQRSMELMYQISKQQDKTEKPDVNRLDKNRPGKRDPSDKKSTAVQTIRGLLNDQFPRWSAALTSFKVTQKDIETSITPGTGQWLFEDSTFKSWQQGDNPLLLLRGPPGIGKTFLAYECVEHLKAAQSANASSVVGCFFFNEADVFSTFVSNSFACISMQIAENHSKYAGQLAAAMEKSKNDIDKPSAWAQLFGLRFPRSTDEVAGGDTLWLVFDGLDDISPEEKPGLLEALATLEKRDSNIRVLVTARSLDDSTLKALQPLIIDADKPKMTPSLKLMVKSRMSSLPRLRKFTKRSKAAIVRQLVLKADGMLYAEHMLRHFSYIGREGAVLKELARMPDTLQDLYELLLTDCQKNRPPEEIKALKRLFAWLAYSESQLTLGQAVALVSIVLDGKAFDIEDEIIGRSSRILDLSYDKSAEVVHENDGETDDEDAEDISHEQTSYQNSSLIFQDRPLRQYFSVVAEDSQQDIRTPASGAHLTIYQMSIDVLLRCAKASGDSTAQELVHYASNFWYHHLVSINIEGASHSTVLTVVTNLYSLMVNSYNVSMVFERYAFVRVMYGTIDEEPGWIKEAKLWIEKAASMSDGLSEDVREWVKRISSGQEGFFLQLSRGHLSNWFNAERSAPLREAFWFAYRALELDSRLDKYETKEEQLLAIAAKYEDDVESWKVSRALGRTLLAFYLNEFDFDEDFDTSMLEDRDETPAPGSTDKVAEEHSDDADQSGVLKKPNNGALAIDHIQKSIETTPSTGRDLFFSYWILSNSYNGISVSSDDTSRQNIARGVEALDKGIEQLSAEEKTALSDEIVLTLLDKAYLLERLDRKAEALDTYEAARKRTSDNVLDGESLYSMTLLVDDKDLLETFKRWSEKERNSWFISILWSWRVDHVAVQRLSNVAKDGGEDGLKFVEQMFDDYQKTATRSSELAISIQIQRAKFQQIAVGDLTKAKELYRAALDTEPLTDDYWGIESLFSNTRMRLADLIYTEFTASSDPEVKLKLMNELKSSPAKEKMELFKSASHIGHLLALMLRAVGTLAEYEKQMELMLDTCVQGLLDDETWNDIPSLRLLAKVCSLVPGMERDATIAVSAQLYDLDSEEVLEEVPSKNEEGGDKQQQEPNLTNGHVTDSREQTNNLMDGHVTDFGNIANGVTVAPKSNGEIPSKDPSPDTIPPTSTEATDATEQAPHDKEIDSGNYGPYCDGCDDVEIKGKWDQPIYLCIQCSNLDFCKECLTKRLKLNRGEEVEGWKASCQPGHAYVKAPIAGWKGIKNGVMYINDESILVKDWLKGLQEVRWKKAWEKVWEQRSVLQTVEI